jgi:hypothetical protein
MIDELTKTGKLCYFPEDDYVSELKVGSIEKLDFSWTRNELEDDDDAPADIVHFTIQENISLDNEPVWLNMANTHDMNDSSFNASEAKSRQLEKMWIQTKKGIDSERKFRVLMMDECSKFSKPSPLAIIVSDKTTVKTRNTA